MSTAETIKAIDAEIQRQEQELQRLREEKAAIAQEENHVDKLFDAVLNCPHSITHESVTLHFYPRQKEGHNALAQLHHRLAAYDQAARIAELEKDAARYRFLRDTCWSSDKELETVISLQMNKVWDEKIDEAMARNKKE